MHNAYICIYVLYTYIFSLASVAIHYRTTTPIHMRLQAFALGEKLGIDPKVLAGVVNRCNRQATL